VEHATRRPCDADAAVVEAERGEVNRGGDEAETGSAATSQQSGARRRPMTGFAMPSGTCWKHLCGCGCRCVGPGVETTDFAHPGGG
jgi:hypothetical protein